MTLKVVPTPKAEQLTRYVRVRKLTKGFVEFDFAIGDPSIYIELILPPAAFEEFCKKNQAVNMTAEQAEMVDKDMRKWRYGEESE